ncbi:flagellin N-terminal helical domain-containing protein [Butyrivibrio sp. VCB2006]|uniref:flagellin N-terminal helical domain-containing protein n=1 Tax=Butyrivibrio sp. VCB2006 TaxID=1280679 RepID=UPI000410B48D|nr:flagellin [Butyrivibrio sp. VCB2006]
MRITNKIMQNNSLYNINNNKITEDQLNTMMSTGKKLTRPSDDPVIAIRALRLRSNVTQLSQYYEKNAKDAESWLNVTADALSTITSVLTDSVKQATKGASKDLTLDDLETIITQMDALAKEYYSTGNVDYAGRYVFTGYRTDTSLTFDKTTTTNYTDINDEFNASAVGESKRILGKYKLDSASVLDKTVDNAVYEHTIVERTVGRIRLSYDNLNYIQPDNGNGIINEAQLKYREDLLQPATSSVSSTMQVINVTFKTTDGVTRTASVPIDNNGNYKITNEEDGATYTATTQQDGSYLVTARDISGNIIGTIPVSQDGVMGDLDPTKSIQSGIASIETKQVSTLTYTDDDKNVRSVNLPLLPAIGQSYEIALDKDGYVATVNSDGTYTVKNLNAVQNSDGTYSNDVINVTANGSVNSSYKETTLVLSSNDDNILYSTSEEADIDAAYEKLYNGEAMAILNASTGEVLLSQELKDKLSTLPDIINAKSIDIVYDKKEWVNGDIRPENLFNCNYTDPNGKTILYNKGNAGHDIAYDVGFAQSVVVNTTASEVFTTGVKRDVQDLSKMLSELKQIDGTIKTLNEKLAATSDDEKRAVINAEIDSAQKAYNYLREEMQQEFEHKITSNQKSLDVANIAVTANGTRSKRLDLVNQRLMNQTTTFKTLQSENEDIDLAETATQLTTAKVTYEASLMATGKISQSSLINYI